LENVPNILSISHGSFMRFLTDWISSLGYRWAYRIIDPRSLGIPHRRPRFFLLAARTIDPAAILFPQDEAPEATVCEAPGEEPAATTYGFYWTSGRAGIGWARNSVPPLKAGGLVPSAPAVWAVRQDFFGTSALEDLERLQGLPPGWTDLAGTEFKQAARWGLLGNAVNANVSTWIGQRIRTGGDGGPRPERTRRIYPGSWPQAAFGNSSGIWSVEASAYPAGVSYTPILEFLQEPLKPLSLKAALGFRRRPLESVQVHYPQRFLDSLDAYLKREYGWQGK
nr:DNA cytosine methyltransferase [Desulfovibrio sp.]